MNATQAVQLRRLFRVVNGGTPTSDEDNWGGGIQWATPVDLGRVHGRTLDGTDRTLSSAGLRAGSAAVPAGSLVVSTRAPIGYVAEATTLTAFNQGCRGLVPKRPVDIRFYRYVIVAMTEQFQAAGQGSTFVELSGGALAQQRLPMPSLQTQRAVANFLDTETGRIDALIAKKRRMIDLLDLRAAATVDRLALGLEHRNRVDSRTPYFSAAPAHWEQTSVRHLACEVQTGPFGSQLHAEEYVEGGWPVVNPANLKQGAIVPIQGMAVSDEKRQELRRHTLQEGDVVFGRRGEMGRVGLVEAGHAGWLCGTGSLRLRLSPHSPLNPAYLKLLLETTALRQYFELTSIGSTMDNLNSDIVLGMPCLVPPAGEQRRIVNEVRALRSSAASLAERLERQIALLQEHRQALITAAVTGELEVPGAAA